MEKVGFSVNCVFDGYHEKKDRSVSLRFVTAVMTNPKEIGMFSSLMGLPGKVLFVEEDAKEADIPEIKTDDIITKTPSQRLRGALWRLQESKIGRRPTDGEFRAYYEKKMNNLIEMVKDQIDG